MKRSIYLLAAAIVCFTGYQAKAQSADGGNSWMKRDVAGAFQLQVTYRNTDLDGLNRILNNNGIPSLSGNDVWINASMLHVTHNWVIEDGIGATPVSTSEANGIKTHFQQYQLFLRFGYNVVNNTQWRLYPFAGVNLTGAMLNIEDKNRQNNTSDFSQELLNSTSSKTFFQGNFGIDLGAGLDYLIPLKEKTIDCFTIQRNIPIGIRAGYYIKATDSDWKVGDHSLDNGPTTNKSAFFATLTIGLGYEVKK